MPQAPLVQNRDEIHKGYVDFDKNEARNMRLQNLGADIGSPVDGLFFYRSDSFKIRARINGAWKDMATMDDVTAGGISSSLVDAKGDLIVATADNTVARKAVGANGTALFANSAQSDGLEWRTIADADLPSTITRDTEALLQILADAKGDLPVATAADTWGKLGVGANDTLLVAASGQATGLQWRTLLAADLQEKIATADLTDWPRVAALDLAGQKITSLADGTATTDAATWGQVQAIIEGRFWKDPVDAATTANITLSAPQTIDTVAVVAGDRVLVKNQSTASQNGIYVVAAGAWTRAIDANTAGEINDATVLVDAGTQKGYIFTQTAVVTTLGTDTVTWTQTGNANITYTADESTLTLTGSVFSVKVGGILNTHIGAGAAIAYSKLNLATSIVNADIAAGAAIAYSKLNLATSIVNADIAAAAGIVGSKLDRASALARVALVSSGALTGGANSEVLTHNLGTRDIAKVTIINNASPFDVQGDMYWEATSTSTVTIYAASGQTLPASYRWVVSA